MAITPGITHTFGTGTSFSVRTGQPIVWECSGTTSTNWSNAWADLDYYWTANGGVATSYENGDSRVRPNVAHGPVAGFVFYTAGEWTVTCTITEPHHGTQSVTTYTITVADPQTIKYYDSSAAGGGDGTLSTPYNSWTTAFAWWLGADATDGVELRCARGSSVDLAADGTAMNSLTGFRRITAYGTGDKPIINATIYQPFRTTGDHSSDGLVFDSLDVRCTNDYCFSGGWAKGGITRCDIQTGSYAINNGGSGVDGNTNDLAWIDCSIRAGVTYIFSFPAANAADQTAASLRRYMCACTCRPYSTGLLENTIRSSLHKSGIYGMNVYATKDPADGGAKALLRLASETASVDAPFIYVGYTRLVNDDNITSTAAVTQDNSGTFSDILFESVFIINSSGSATQVVNVAGLVNRITFKNCKIISLVANQQQISASTFLSSGIRMLNCTFYSPTGTTNAFRWQAATVNTVEAKNCLIRFIGAGGNTFELSNDGGAADFDIDGCWIDGSHASNIGYFKDDGSVALTTYNTTYSTSNVNGHGLDPVFNGHYDIDIGSPCIGAGLAAEYVPVYRDFYGRARSASVDIGASMYPSPFSNKGFKALRRAAAYGLSTNR